MTDLYIKLNIGLDEIKEMFDRINRCENKAFALLESGLINKLHHINELYRHFICDNDDVSLDYSMKRRSISVKHEEIINAYHYLFKKQFDDIDSTGGDKIADAEGYYGVKSPIFIMQDASDEVLNFYEGGAALFPDFLETEDEFYDCESNGFITPLEFYDSKINWDATGMRQMYISLEKMYGIFKIVASYKDKLLESYSMSKSRVYGTLLKEFKRYSITQEKTTFRVLRKIAQGFKQSRNHLLSEDTWAAVMKGEDEILRCAIEGQTSNENQTMHDFYDKRTLLDLRLNYPLLQKVLDNSVDGSLFDFEYAFRPEIDIFSVLNENNWELLFQMVLRRNLIQCEMFPELKSEYREFLKDEENEDAEKEHTKNDKVQSNGAKPIPFVIHSEQSEEVVAYVKELMEGKTKPKDILKSLRAAQDAGVIRKPTWEEFNEAFPDSGVKYKSSLTNYTKADAKPYENDKSFEEMIEDFKKRFLSD